MFYKVKFDIEDFSAWSGGNNTKQDILNANKEDEFNSFIKEVFLTKFQLILRLTIFYGLNVIIFTNN